MPETYCPPVPDDRGRSSDDPCAVFCGGADFDAWKRKALERIGQALFRDDLPEIVKAKLIEWRQQIELLPRSKIDSGDAVRMMASMTRQAECIALAPTKEAIPDTTDVKDKDRKFWETKEFLLLAIAGAGFAAWKFGLLDGLLSKKTKKRRKAKR